MKFAAVAWLLMAAPPPAGPAAPDPAKPPPGVDSTARHPSCPAQQSEAKAHPETRSARESREQAIAECLEFNAFARSKGILDVVCE